MPKQLVPNIPDFPFKVGNGVTTKLLDPLLSQEHPHLVLTSVHVLFPQGVRLRLGVCYFGRHLIRIHAEDRSKHGLLCSTGLKK